MGLTVQPQRRAERERGAERRSGSLVCVLPPSLAFWGHLGGRGWQPEGITLHDKCLFFRVLVQERFHPRPVKLGPATDEGRSLGRGPALLGRPPPVIQVNDHPSYARVVRASRIETVTRSSSRPGNNSHRVHLGVPSFWDMKTLETSVLAKQVPLFVLVVLELFLSYRSQSREIDYNLQDLLQFREPSSAFCYPTRSRVPHNASHEPSSPVFVRFSTNRVEPSS